MGQATAIRRSALSGPELTDAEFREACELVYSLSGLDLAAGKQSLIMGRLGPIVSRRGYPTFAAYFQAVKTDTSGRIRSEFVDRLTTNHTFFHREPEHLEFFAKTALPEAIARRRSEGRQALRVWCAASSTGEEPYTLAMLVLEALGHGAATWDTGVLATDISPSVLETARTGRYEKAGVERLPDHLRRKYFRELPGDMLEVSQKVRDEVTFRKFNLLNVKYPFKNPFDVVFCRNVMIYFDSKTRRNVVERMLSCTRVGGYLIVGAAESIPEGFAVTQVGPSIFRRER